MDLKKIFNLIFSKAKSSLNTTISTFPALTAFPVHTIRTLPSFVPVLFDLLDKSVHNFIISTDVNITLQIYSC